MFMKGFWSIVISNQLDIGVEKVKRRRHVGIRTFSFLERKGSRSRVRVTASPVVASDSLSVSHVSRAVHALDNRVEFVASIFVLHVIDIVTHFSQSNKKKGFRFIRHALF